MTTMPFRTAALGIVLCAGACALPVRVVAAAEEALDDGERPARLDVAGGSIEGELAPVPAVDGGVRDTFLWRSPRFVEPLEFRFDAVAGVTHPRPTERPAVAGPFVHLAGGDMLAATVQALDADALVVEVAGPDGPQRLRVARQEVVAITRGGDGVGTYLGPSGLGGWEQVPGGSWREEAGRIMTEKVGAAASRDVGAPARARFDIRLSRRKATEFRVAVAAAERPENDGFFLQAVDGDAAGGLMLVRRAGGRAAIEPLPAAPWRGDVLWIVIFVDQDRGRLAAILPDAEGAAAREVTLAPPANAAAASGRFRLELNGGDICLERLEVTPWRGAEPALHDPGQTGIVTRAGAVAGFAVSSFDAARQEYVLVGAGGETKRVAAADVEEIRFPGGAGEPVEPTLRVVRRDGGTIAGDLVKVDERALWIRRRGIDGDIAVPRDAIESIRTRRVEPPAAEPPARVGTLIVGADRLRGWLVGAADGGLAWQPLGSPTAAALATPIDAEVEYVARRPEKRPNDAEVGGIGGLVNRDAEGFFIVAMMTEDGAAARDGRIQPGDRILAIAPTERSRFVETKELDNETVTHLLRGRIGTVVRLKVADATGANPRDIELRRGAISVAGREILDQALQTHARLAGVEEAAPDPRDAFPALVVLRSGDVAPCRIDAIDADAVILHSPLVAAGGDEVRVPGALVKAVELVPAAASRALDKTLLDRLLTLPRMQRDRPPTHLLRLLDGDYLRGRLVRLDDKAVTFELLDVVKQLPRSQVARIIWLHPEPPSAEAAADTEPADDPGAADDGLTVQGVGADGRRLTLSADRVDGNSVHGRSRAFGASAIDLTRVDRLLLGAAIGRDGRDLPFGKWTLKPAPEPRALGKPDRE